MRVMHKHAHRANLTPDGLYHSEQQFRPSNVLNDCEYLFFMYPVRLVSLSHVISCVCLPVSCVLCPFFSFHYLARTRRSHYIDGVTFILHFLVRFLVSYVSHASRSDNPASRLVLLNMPPISLKFRLATCFSDFLRTRRVSFISSSFPDSSHLPSTPSTRLQLNINAVSALLSSFALSFYDS